MAATRIVSQDVRDGTLVNADINASAAIDPTKIADGSVDATEFQRLGAVTSAIVGTSDTQTLTNKTLVATNNTVAASGLHTATTIVSIAAATAPSNGQVLTATSSTTATWQTPGTALATSNFVWNEIPAGSINGSNPSFVLANTASATGSIRVYKNGLRQRPGAAEDYDYDGLTGFHFIAGNIPQTNDNIIVDYMK
jgi:hypothetical protein